MNLEKAEWKQVPVQQLQSLNEMGGFYELEELEGIQVIRTKTEDGSGTILSFQVSYYPNFFN